MMRDGRLRIVLFALTGFGNTVLEALLNDMRVHVEAVFTVKYDRPFPYYAEVQLLELCGRHGIVCYSGLKVSSDEGIALLKEHAPDLILVATFKEVLRPNVLALPRLGVVNFHPSLLPRYRGPCPTSAVLANGETITGVTVHYVTEQMDEGNILLQRLVDIADIENDGQLRQKLARLAGQLTPEVVGMFLNGDRPSGAPQDHRLASYAPRPTAEDGYLELASDIQTISRKLRAFNPLPGTSILVGNQRVAVDHFELIRHGEARAFGDDTSSLDVVVDSQTVRFFPRCDTSDRNSAEHRVS